MTDTVNADTTWTVPKPIAEALVKLQAAVQTVEKGGYNKNQNYKFVRETDLVDKVRPAMVELGLTLHQTTVFYDHKLLGEARSGASMYLTTVGIAFTWVHVTGVTYPVPGVFYGTGADTGDKGVYKAATGAAKYFLMKTFLVGTGDDPEADEKVDKHMEADRAMRGTTVTRGNQPGVQRGGKSSVATDAQRAELKRTAKELNITKVEDLQALVTRIIKGYGAEPPVWADTAAFGAYLKELDGQKMGELIVAAKKMVGDTADEAPAGQEEGDDDLGIGYN